MGNAGWRARACSAFTAIVLAACDAGAGSVTAPSFGGSLAQWRVNGAGHSAVVQADALLIAPHGVDLVSAGAEIRTVRIDRAGAATGTLGRAVAVRHDDVVQIERGEGCTEELENRPHGVEQRWRFDSAPSGGGDLVVEVEAADASLTSASSEGLHLRARSGFPFRYGHATWIDATGSATDMPVEWVDGRISIHVPSEIVDASEYPAVLDPIISTETAVDAPVLSPSASSETAPSAAFDGTTHFVTWNDSRDWGFALYGARISAGGVVLDEYGIQLATNAGSHGGAVAAGASDWLVAWPFVTSTSGGGLEAVRVAPDGSMLGTPTTILAASSTRPSDLRIASDGTNYLVTYRRGSQVGALRVLADGTAPGAPVTVTTSAQRHDLAWGGGRYFAVWDDGSSVRGARLAADGTLLDATPIAIATDGWQQIDPAVASDGTGFLVVWQDARDLVFAGIDIWGARVDASGSVGAAFVIGGATRDQQMPTAAFDGVDYHVAWEDGRDPLLPAIYGGRVTAGGALRDGTGFRIDDTPRGDTLPLMSSAPGHVLALWDYELNLVARPVSSAGAPSATSVFVATAGNAQEWPRIVEGSSGYLAMWTDHRAWPDYGDIYVARLDSDGNPIGAAIPVGTGPAAQEAGGVAFDGAQYLVAWGQDDGTGYDIYGSRIDATTGAVLDPGGRLLVTETGDQHAPAVSHDGTSWLVAWMDGRAPASGTRSDVYAARFDAALSSLDGTGVPLSSVQRAEWPVWAAAVPGTHFVMWKLLVPGSTTVEARGARIVGGTVLDPEGRALGGIEPLGVDADGTELMALSLARDGMLRAAHMDAAGTISIHTVFIGPGLYAGDVTWDGTGWLTVFQQRGIGSDQIRGLRVTSAGSIIEGPFDIAPTGGYRYFTPRAASTGGGRSIVGYSRYTPGAPYETFRVWTRTVGGDLLVDGTTCTSASACASGYCVSGICCATACDDGLVCNGAETCPGGTCAASTPPTCDDGDACTADACSEPLGCVFAPIAGCGDAGLPDAGPPDAGSPELDAGPAELDAGTPDAGSRDGGTPDAGARDAGAEPIDAGPPDEGLDAGVPHRERDGGCGCRAPPGGQDGSAVLLLFIAWCIRRRSRRARLS